MYVFCTGGHAFRRADQQTGETCKCIPEMEQSYESLVSHEPSTQFPWWEFMGMGDLWWVMDGMIWWGGFVSVWPFWNITPTALSAARRFWPVVAMARLLGVRFGGNLVRSFYSCMVPMYVLPDEDRTGSLLHAWSACDIMVRYAFLKGHLPSTYLLAWGLDG